MNKFMPLIFVLAAFAIFGFLKYVPVRTKNLTIKSIIPPKSLSSQMKKYYKYKHDDDSTSIAVQEIFSDGTVDTNVISSTVIQGKVLPVAAKEKSSVFHCTKYLTVL